MNKVHICNIICLCPLQGEQEAKPSRDCSIFPDRAAFRHRQIHQQGGQGSFSVVWKQFQSVIYFFLLQVQADSVHGNWLPECTALLSYPQGRLHPRDHRPLYFFSLLYLLLQLGEGFLLILVLQIHDRIKQANFLALLLSFLCFPS